MAYVESAPHPKSKKYRAGFINWEGKKSRFTGTINAKETLMIARKQEADHAQIRLGYRDAPKSWDSAKGKDITDAVADYLAWGNSQGGRGGRPWSSKHAQKREYYLRFWVIRLGLKSLGDLEGILSRAEEALRELQTTGRPLGVSILSKSCPKARPLSGKSLQNYSEGLCSFCDWLVERGFLDRDPLKGLAAFDTTPKTQRRAMTKEEVYRFLSTIAEEGTVYAKRRRLGYELALASGLRKGELQALRVKHLDIERSGLLLDAAWTKNRKAGFKELPSYLVERLAVDCRGKGPNESLVFVADKSARSFRNDLGRAKIPVMAAGGKLDFHALRTAYVTFCYEAGAHDKEAQTMARHATAGLTSNTYARTRNTRLGDLAEGVGKFIKLNPRKIFY